MNLTKTMTTKELCTALLEGDCNTEEFVNQLKTAAEVYTLVTKSKVSQRDALILLQRYEEWVADNSSPLLTGEVANALSILLEKTLVEDLFVLPLEEYAGRVNHVACYDLRQAREALKQL